MAEELHSILEKVSQLTRPGIKADEVMDTYKAWAKMYDKDRKTDGYTGPIKVSKVLAESQGGRKDIRVLDVAAGTGLCGEELSKLDFCNIDALDASQDMLDVAKTKNVYRNFIKEFLGPNRLGIDDGGVICLALRENRLHTNEGCKDLESRMAALQSECLWQQVSREIFPGYSSGDDGVVYLYRVL
ncbi:methyltransferase-like protein 27 isoform X2 [Branchiostoma floridae x Branchiostoma japonicum]